MESHIFFLAAHLESRHQGLFSTYQLKGFPGSMTQVSRPLGLRIATPGQVSMPPTPTGHHTSFNSAVTRCVSPWADHLVFPLRCVRLYVSGLGFKTELNISQDLTKLNIKLLIPLRLK